MGLDQWLMAKTKIKVTDEHTSVCSGMFGIIPKTVAEKQEIGYWRKGYDQDQLINFMVAAPQDEEGNVPITAEEVDDILEEARRILKEHKFDEDGYDETDDDPKFESETATWMSKSKWEDTIKFFEKAKEILQKDPDAKIYYHIWY